MKLIHPFGTVVEVDDEYGARLLLNGYQEVTESASGRSAGRSKPSRARTDSRGDDAGSDASS
ncbi:DUF7302 family protein [Nocardia sp. IFM 10818]